MIGKEATTKHSIPSLRTSHGTGRIVRLISCLLPDKLHMANFLTHISLSLSLLLDLSDMQELKSLSISFLFASKERRNNETKRNETKRGYKIREGEEKLRDEHTVTIQRDHSTDRTCLSGACFHAQCNNSIDIVRCVFRKTLRL